MTHAIFNAQSMNNSLVTTTAAQHTNSLPHTMHRFDGLLSLRIHFQCALDCRRLWLFAVVLSRKWDNTMYVGARCCDTFCRAFSEFRSHVSNWRLRRSDVFRLAIMCVRAIASPQISKSIRQFGMCRQNAMQLYTHTHTLQPTSLNRQMNERTNAIQRTIIFMYVFCSSLGDDEMIWCVPPWHTKWTVSANKVFSFYA